MSHSYDEDVGLNVSSNSGEDLPYYRVGSDGAIGDDSMANTGYAETSFPC